MWWNYEMNLKPSEKTCYKSLIHRNLEYSESYEKYLEHIFRLSLKNPGGWVKNKEISQRLNVKAPSVTNMLNKLSKAQLIEWKPRHGIRLTKKGRVKAKNLVTNHILFELFLQRILKMEDFEEINNLSCGMEHHISPKMQESLIELLGISSEMKNIDNYILEDKFPEHIITHSIYTENNIENLLKILKTEIVEKLNLKTQNIEILSDLFKNFKRP